ncbi:hypothetical protein [Luteitalea sp.]|uniref:hypothetical protein n=1 Tax=Luteitalea sp. TaxID=2004800 RepID=UPI0025C55DDB|nr:hypothetical protein [Luteitalea sp.]
MGRRADARKGDVQRAKVREGDTPIMRDFLFVSFFLGHKKGDAARRLLSECGLLETAMASPANRNAWFGESHSGVSLRLPVEDSRLEALLQRLQQRKVAPFTRLDREYSVRELDSADWLVMRVATAGLWGGVDYGQQYERQDACATCGAGAVPIAPLLADLNKMGKKPLDHLVYEGHLIASRSLARGLERLGVTGFESLDVRTQRRPPSENFVWLRIAGDFPRFDPSSTGYEIEDCCPACQRAGHYGNWSQGESPCAAVPTANADMNLSWEYYGNWRQTRRTEDGWVPVGGFRAIVVSQKARRAFIQLGVRRIVWVPMRTAPPAG